MGLNSTERKDLLYIWVKIILLIKVFINLGVFQRKS